MPCVHPSGDADPGAASFGSDFTSMDSATRTDELLGFLDEVAATEVVREVKRRATAALELAPGDRILDIGCGTGVDLEEMLEPTLPGGHVTGIDVSVAAIEEADRRFAARPEIDVLVADVHELPFEDGSFDAARADRVLLHLEQPDRALAEVRRVLAPGGRLAILEMVVALNAGPALLEHPVHAAIRHRFWAAGEHRDHINFFLPLLLAQAGFAGVQAGRGALDTADYGAANAILRLHAGVRDASESGRIDEREGASWLEAVRTALSRREASARVSYLCHLARVTE